MNLAQRDVNVGEVVIAERLLDRCPAAQRGWEWDHCFSPDGQQILTGTEGEHPGIARDPGGLKLWDVATGRKIRTLLSHAEYAGVWELEFNQDGTRA